MTPFDEGRAAAGEEGVKHTCPSCRNQFVQPFVCTTCGAQKLHDHTMDTLEAELERMRPVYRAAMRWHNDPTAFVCGGTTRTLFRACSRAKAERMKGRK